MTENAEPTRLEQLKEQAKLMGIEVRGNMSEATLAARIAAKRDGTDEPAETAAPAKEAPKLSKSQLEAKLRLEQIKEQTALVRIRITCLNPLKAEWGGEIITVGNAYIGTHRKFVPFGEQTDNGYHVPKIIFEELKSRKFHAIRTKNVNGVISTEGSRVVPEFAIEVLPPLTPEELKNLATAQAAAAGLSD